MATAKLIPHSPDLDHVLQHADAIRAAVTRFGASSPRFSAVGPSLDDPDPSRIHLIVNSRPKLSLFGLVNLEEELRHVLGVPVSVDTEQGLAMANLARLLANAVPV